RLRPRRAAAAQPARPRGVSRGARRRLRLPPDDAGVLLVLRPSRSPAPPLPGCPRRGGERRAASRPPDPRERPALFPLLPLREPGRSPALVRAGLGGGRRAAGRAGLPLPPRRPRQGRPPRRRGPRL